MRKSLLFLYTLLITASCLNAAGPGAAAPEISAVNAKEEAVSLRDYAGKVVFLNFWASWCPPCRSEFPELDSLAAEYSEKDLVVIAINLDRNRSSADDFIDNYEKSSDKTTPGSRLSWNMKILFDRDNATAQAYSVPGIPASFIIGRNGGIRYKHTGFQYAFTRKWREEIDSLLAEKFVPRQEDDENAGENKGEDNDAEDEE
ncbi:MAG: TlpA family protein disulfide reductase [Elusimicrobia bacterium]|nr:TlpA family protein disulfide reductase [Elusimicrobiota bacterium]